MNADRHVAQKEILTGRTEESGVHSDDEMLRNAIAMLPPSFFRRVKEREGKCLAKTKRGKRAMAGMLSMGNSSCREGKAQSWHRRLIIGLALMAVCLLTALVFVAIGK
jgi:hypothetical protein